MKGKPKLHLLYEYQLNSQYLLNCGFYGQIIAKNKLNRPYLSSQHVRNRSPQTCYNSAIFQSFCKKLSESLKNRKNLVVVSRFLKFACANFGIWPPLNNY